MSWEAIIDQMKEWVQAQGYLTSCYVDRGDPAARDYATWDFLINAAWHELDLSAIVPVGAKAVALSLIWGGATVAQRALFRKHGNANAWAIAGVATQVSYVYIYGDLVVALDSNRKIDYLFDPAGVEHIDLTVKGWWL